MTSTDSTPPSDKLTVDDPDARARISAHTPILFDERTNEPYLPLPAPNSQYRLTSARFSDAEDVSRVLSTLSVARNLIGPPFPYSADRYCGWFRMLRSTAVSAFDQLKEGNYQLLRGSPFCMMREVKDDGTDIYVGEVSIGLCEGKKRATPFKQGMEDWRSSAVWSAGACLSEEFHGRGLAKAAFSVLLHSFVIPHLGATEIEAWCFVRNVASAKLWQGAGFVKDEKRSGAVVHVDKAKGGGEEEEICLVWSL